jgi:hypothetical protein
MCILNEIGDDYYWDVICSWLRRDPSPYVAVLIAGAAYFGGLRIASIRVATIAFLVAALPLSIWIWDVPFTGRVICRSFHDGQSAIRTLHLYAFCLGAWPILLWLGHGTRLSTLV